MPGKAKSNSYKMQNLVVQIYLSFKVNNVLDLEFRNNLN